MWHRADQRAGVRVLRCCPDVLGGPRLDDLAEVHDRHGVGDVVNDREVVRDQQQAQGQLSRQLEQQVRYLCLRRCVERGEWLVEHDQRRVGRERARDRDALALPAAELVREAAARGGGKPDELEQLRDARIPGRAVSSAPSGEPVADLVADLAARVERGVRVLEHELEPGEVVRAGTSGEWGDLAALEAHAASGWGDQPDGGAGEARLPATRFADEPDDRSALDRQARSRDGLEARAVPPFVRDLEAVDLEDAHGAKGSTGQACAPLAVRISSGTVSSHSPTR